MKWKLYEEKNHFGAAKFSTRTHKTYCSSNTFNYNTKLIVNASQLSLLLEGVFDGFIYLRADP